jgi:hypothetical protein
MQIVSSSSVYFFAYFYFMAMPIEATVLPITILILQNAHYELIMSPQDKNTAHARPSGQNNSAVTFKISACINRYAGLSKQGEFHF